MFINGFGFGPSFGIFQILFFLVFFFIFGTIVLRVISRIKTWNSNNHQPILTVTSTVTSKRTHVQHHHHNTNNNMGHSTTTHYFITFEVESGDRMELQVHGHDYGLLSEGDQGQLTFQGTRFKGFKR